jgi:SWI/SNF-related matrix-associated actin-dependent regulator of chromatin subfamily A3
MGLGKTLEIIALICSPADGAGVLPTARPISDVYSNSTLIVCPLSVIGNWELQIRMHCQPDRLKTYVYHGPNKNSSAQFLQEHDVVVTTYETLRSYNPRATKSGLHAVRWRRVILDEGHVIRSRKAKQSEAAFALNAERRFIVSGTPIQNNVWGHIFILFCLHRHKPLTRLRG